MRSTMRTYVHARFKHALDSVFVCVCVCVCMWTQRMLGSCLDICKITRTFQSDSVGRVPKAHRSHASQYMPRLLVAVTLSICTYIRNIRRRTWADCDLNIVALYTTSTSPTGNDPKPRVGSLRASWAMSEFLHLISASKGNILAWPKLRLRLRLRLRLQGHRRAYFYTKDSSLNSKCVFLCMYACVMPIEQQSHCT
jgi:hypothetical protein